jgi:adenylate cyclase
MNSDETSFPGWFPTLAVVAVAIAFIVADPAGLASRLATHEFGLFRALHATAGIARPVDSIPAQVLFLEAIGTALVLLISLRRYAWVVGVALVSALAAQASSWLLYIHLDALFDTANASLAIVLAGITALLVEPFCENEPRRRVTIRRRTPPAEPAGLQSPAPVPTPVADALVLTSLSCSLRHAPALGRIFDGDVAGFMRLVESVMAPLVDDAIAQGAWVSRFDGISFAAQWPAAGGAHADQACDAAGRVIAEMARANEQLALQWPRGDHPCPTLEIGIGLASGKTLAGTMRAGGRAESCLVPQDGVTAERLGFLTERYGSAAIASETTVAAVERAHAFLEVDFVALDPGAAPVRLYALLGNALVRASPKFRAVAIFHQHIFQCIRSQQWEKARSLIEQCRKISGANPKLYNLHLDRIAWYEADPPPPDWDGAFRPPLR